MKSETDWLVRLARFSHELRRMRMRETTQQAIVPYACWVRDAADAFVSARLWGTFCKFSKLVLLAIIQLKQTINEYRTKCS